MNIDYDVGDLIVAVKDSESYPNLIKKGQVFTCLDLCESTYSVGAERFPCLAVAIEIESPKPHNGTWVADRFKKLPKKSSEFFVGELQEIKETEDA